MRGREWYLFVVLFAAVGEGVVVFRVARESCSVDAYAGERVRRVRRERRMERVGLVN
jgi:hypothetical protein